MLCYLKPSAQCILVSTNRSGDLPKLSPVRLGDETKLMSSVQMASPIVTAVTICNRLRKFEMKNFGRFT